MTKDELSTLLKEFLEENKNPYYFTGKFPSNCGDTDDAKFQGFRSDSWITGGTTGGDYTGNESNIPIPAEEPKRIELLDKFLEQKRPSTTFLEYREIEKCFKTEEYGKSEHYGNYVEKKISYITFADLVEVISSFNYNSAPNKIKPR